MNEYEDKCGVLLEEKAKYRKAAEQEVKRLKTGAWPRRSGSVCGGARNVSVKIDHLACAGRPA